MPVGKFQITHLLLKFYNLPGNVTGQEAIAISHMDEVAQQPEEAIMKEVTSNTGKVYAGSGSRSLKEDPMMFDKVVIRLIEIIEMSKPAMLITGMAEGFDEALAIAAMATNTPLKAMVPFKGYCNHYWGVKSVTGRNRLAECKEILATRRKCALYVWASPHAPHKPGSSHPARRAWSIGTAIYELPIR